MLVVVIFQQKVRVAVIVQVSNTFKMSISIVNYFHCQFLLILVSDISRSGFHIDVNLSKFVRCNVPIAISVEIAYYIFIIPIAEFLFS